MLLRFVGFTDPEREGQPTAVDGYGLWTEGEVKNVQDDLGNFLLYGEHFERVDEPVDDAETTPPAKGKKAPADPPADAPTDQPSAQSPADTTVDTPQGDPHGGS